MKFKYIGKDHTIISTILSKDTVVKEGEIVESTKDIQYFLKNGFVLVQEVKEDIKEIELPKRGRPKQS